jgi:NADPH:quinone reductase-like Zn-dependent oxidoreductase
VRALTISAHGGLDQLEYRTDLPVPDLPRKDYVRVRVQAAALNHLDLFVLGGLPGVTIEPPWVMGADGAGVVEEVGPKSRGVKVGDTVIINPGISDGTCEYCREGDEPLCLNFGILGEHHPGTLAEYVAVPSMNVRPIPPTIPIEAAAAFPLATLTAWRMIVAKARVGRGDRVLIWGIGGGVALQCLQIAKLRGATVWVTSSSDRKLEWALGLGADGVFNHTTTDVAAEVRARTNKRGADVVIDNVGQATWGQSLRALGKRGRLVTCGATSGAIVQTDVRRLFWNQWTIMGSTMGTQDEFSTIAAHLAHGQLVPPVDSVYRLEQGADAFERLSSGLQFGKIVIRI